MTGERNAAEVHHRFLHGDADALPLAGELALIERDQYADGQLQSRTGVGEGGARFERWPVRLTRERNCAASRLGDRVEAAKVPIRTLFAKTAHRPIDDPRVDLADGVIMQAELLRRPGRKILEKHIALADQ